MNQAELTQHFPYAHFHADWNLVTWHPSGVLDNARADHVIQFLEMQEARGGTPFHRFVDLTGYSQIKIELAHLAHLALLRRDSYQGASVKSALYATRLLTIGIARMYQELMDGSLIQVGVFRQKTTVADWLGVPESILNPNPGIDS